MMLRFALLAFVGATLVASPIAHADELQEFREGRSAYDTAEYSRAVTILQNLCGGALPSARNPGLTIECRKYLAAAYLSMDRQEDAERQFEAILREEPDFALDPAVFPRAVLAIFEQVKERVEAATQQEDRRRQEAEAAERDRQMRTLLEQQERYRQLLELASVEVVEERHSRLVASVPFGLGQFQNGDRSLGIGMATGQLSLAAVSMVSFFFHRSLLADRDADGLDESRFVRRERAWRIANLVSVSALGTLMVIGIVESHLSFRSVVRTERPRELPEGLQDAPPSPVLEVGLGPTQAHLTLRF